MFKTSKRRLAIYIAAGLVCFTLLTVWNSTKYLKGKVPDIKLTKPDDEKIYHDLQTAVPKSHDLQMAVPKSHDAVPKSKAEQKTKPDKRFRQNPHKKVKSGEKGIETRTKLDRAQQKNSDTHTTSVLDQMKTAAVTQLTTVRPLKCSGCFQTNFPVLTDQPELCQVTRHNAIDIVFLIVSAHKNSARRDAIRKTWASVTKNNTAHLRHVFMLGTTPNAKLMQAVEREAELYHDVVITGFHDSYRNLTLKVVTSLRWFITRCRKARFFMKVDDDVWINTAVMTSLLRNHSDFLQHGMGGHCSHTFRPRRGKGSKWYVPESLYSGDRYPAYCQGLAYTSSLAVARQIVNVSVDVPFFHIEDVYVGMCLNRLGFGTKPLGKFKHHRTSDDCQGQDSHVPTIHNVPPQRMMQLWAARCPPASDDVVTTAGPS